MKFQSFSREILKLHRLGVGALPQRVLKALTGYRIKSRHQPTLPIMISPPLRLAPLIGIGGIPLLSVDVKSVKKQEKMELTSNLHS